MNQLHFSALDQLDAATQAAASDLDAYSLGYIVMLATVVCVLAVWLGVLVWNLTADVRPIQPVVVTSSVSGAQP